MPTPAYRHTLVVPDAFAFGQARLVAARAGAVGRQVVTIEGLVERLAGPFLRAPDAASVRAAVARARRADLGDLASIAPLPGFVRAAAASLARAWQHGLDPRRAPTSHPRWASFAALERAVVDHLPPDVRLPRELAAMAAKRAALAPSLLGPVTLHHLDDVAPCWRPVLAELAEHVEVTWRSLDPERPPWLPESIAFASRDAAPGALERVACATPAHEALEALRWARGLIASGRAAPHDITIAAASPAPYDAAVHAAARAAELPLHAVHGLPLAETPVGARVLALAEAMVRGPSLDRVRRVVDALGPTLPTLAQPLATDAWWREVRSDAPLTTPERWARAIGGRDVGRDGGRDGRGGGDAAARWLLDLVAALAAGPAEASPTGDTYLDGEASAAWRRALDDGPAHALTASAARLRTGDGVEPAGAIAYGPATTLARSPRPFAWLLGVSSRSWPRRAVADPLLPEHVLGAPWPGPSVADLDRRAFRRFERHCAGAVVLSRARRDGDGRQLAPSPLLVDGAAAAVAEVTLSPTRAPEHALDEADRLANRPAERSADPLVASATRAWHDWRADRLTPHDGLVRPHHPALLRAMARTHSATSLQRLLRNPQGFVWRYALGFEEPDATEEPFELDPRAFGTLVHDVLERAARSLDAGRVGAFALSDADAVVAAVDAALSAAARETETNASVPPPVAWRRVQLDARDVALAALRHELEALPDGRTYVEVPFGNPRHATREATPWDPAATVAVGRAGLRIGGSIDRLDVAGDRSRARVIDYKTGRVRDAGGLRGLRGGQELQRCLYALAARHFLGTEVHVEALLLYPRDARAFDLHEPDVALAELVAALDAAHADVVAGRALPGPDAFGPYNDLALALPADATRRYGARKAPLVRESLPALAALWGEP